MQHDIEAMVECWNIKVVSKVIFGDQPRGGAVSMRDELSIAKDINMSTSDMVV